MPGSETYTVFPAPHMSLTVKGTINVMEPPRVKGGMAGLGSPIYHSGSHSQDPENGV